MAKAPRTELGITLLETLLVLSVGAALVTMGLRFYKQWTNYIDTQNLVANVDQLFTAMQNYYQANCRYQLDSLGNPVSLGTLDPSSPNYTGTPFVLTINDGGSGTAQKTDLYTLGFLSSRSWHPTNPIVDSSPTDKGYFIQFNRQTDTHPSVYACPGNTTGPTTCTASTATQLTSTNSPPLNATIVFWTSQVAVKVRDTAKSAVLRAELNADCGTTSSTDTCSSGSASAAADNSTYLVWERPAIMITESLTSPLWVSSPLTKQFNMQYTNDGMSALSDVKSTRPIQNYLCGG